MHDAHDVNDNIPEEVQNKSSVIQNLYTDFFESQRQVYSFSNMVGGSDYLPFLERNIPSGYGRLLFTPPGCSVEALISGVRVCLGSGGVQRPGDGRRRDQVDGPAGGLRRLC